VAWPGWRSAVSPYFRRMFGGWLSVESVKRIGPSGPLAEVLSPRRGPLDVLAKA